MSTGRTSAVSLSGSGESAYTAPLDANTTCSTPAAEDARSKIRAGATLVQLYTGLVYRGPQLVTECLRALGG